MKYISSYFVLLLGFILSASAWSECPATGESNVQLQILGSGGPRDSGGRASSSYILWIDGVGRIMVDAGSGTKVAFHQSGANFDDIDLVALSHFHPDHSAELPASLWPAGGSFAISGPTAGNGFPSLEDFLDSLFGQRGAFNILQDRIELDPITVDVSSADSAEVWRDGEILVQGKSVPHGTIPAIGYRVDIGDYSIAFTSDQNGSDASFIDFIRDVDVLVIHMASTEEGNSPLHAKPSVWGQMAEAANAGHVVVSHIATSSPQVLQTSVEVLRNNYTGPVTVGEDLMCVEVK